jgi:hypothetical protein
MLNFENEIYNIKDRHLKYFFGWDYFHDGNIYSIRIVDDKDVEITLSSYRDWENDLSYENKSQPVNEVYNAKDYEYQDKYMYICKFRNCKYYDSQISDNGYIFLNGRFKDSAKVREINEKSYHKNLHLRIQTTGGYIDIIFNKFEIKKVIGEIVIPKKVSNILNYSNIEERFKNKSLDMIRDRAENGDSIDKMQAIHYLGSTNNCESLKFALKSLSEEDAQIPAIWIIGNHGNVDVLPELFNEWATSEGLLKRHIQDSIEKIVYRNKATLNSASDNL